MNLYIDFIQHNSNVTEDDDQLTNLLKCDYCIKTSGVCEGEVKVRFQPTISTLLCNGWRPMYELIY